MKILIAIPAYNEAEIIKDNLIKLDNFLRTNLLADEYLIVVADNNSQDQTAKVVNELAGINQQIDYLFVEQKGKGIAIRSAWEKYLNEHDIFSFMDADLATGLEAFVPLIEKVKNNHDIAIGSRYLAESQNKRSLLRRCFSGGYRLVLRLLLGTKIKDFPCGFKAINKKTAQEILPLVKNNEWFFDSELIYLAWRAGYKIAEIPVNWQEPRTGENKSRVSLFKQTIEYLKELIRLRFRK